MRRFLLNLARSRILIGALLLIWLSLFAGCQRSLLRVYIEVDHGTRTLETNATTVRELLAEAGIALGELDRVNPDLNFSVKPEMTIRVIRVSEETETQIVSIPFERQIVTNEAFPPGEQRLAQLGENGQEEIVTRISFEDGREVSRAQISKMVIKEPVAEILVVGAKKAASSVPIEGVAAYLSGGNAWMMKDSSDARRPLTTKGDLDGRVFDLSPDGSKLLFTRLISEAVDAPLNELWLVDTRIVGEEPISLPIKGVLYAAWSPRLTETVIAYSTAERVASQPGWRANNDLWLWDITQEISSAVEIVAPNTDGLYAWWGTNYAWSPAGNAFAYANANQVGVIDVLSKTVTILMEFAPYQTNSNWVWAPTVSWSPNSKLVATVIHGLPQQNEKPEASPVFDLWLLAADGRLKVKARAEVGMWSNPVWYYQGIAFGQAINPLSSVDSRYKLTTMDWDGSNSQVVFPLAEESGVVLPEIAWEPQLDGASFLFVNRRNLFLLGGDGTPPQQLTSDNQSHRPEWVIPPEATKLMRDPISVTSTITQTSSTTLPTVISNTTSVIP